MLVRQFRRRVVQDQQNSAHTASEQSRDRVAALTIRNELLAAAKVERELPALQAFGVFDLTQIEEHRAINADEFVGRQHIRQVLERRARQVALVADVDRDVVAVDLQIVDLVRVQNVEAMSTLPDQARTMQQVRRERFDLDAQGLLLELLLCRGSLTLQREIQPIGSKDVGMRCLPLIAYEIPSPIKSYSFFYCSPRGRWGADPSLSSCSKRRKYAANSRSSPRSNSPSERLKSARRHHSRM